MSDAPYIGESLLLCVQELRQNEEWALHPDKRPESLKNRLGSAYLEMAIVFHALRKAGAQDSNLWGLLKIVDSLRTVLFDSVWWYTNGVNWDAVEMDIKKVGRSITFELQNNTRVMLHPQDWSQNHFPYSRIQEDLFIEKETK